MRASPAAYWVLVLQGFTARNPDCVVIRPAELLKRLEAVHRRRDRIIQSYIWGTNAERCWETRGLRKEDQRAVAAGEYRHAPRSLTRYLNNWSPLARLRRPAGR